MEELLKIIDSIAEHIKCTPDDIRGRLDFSIIQEENSVVIRISDVSSPTALHLIRKLMERYNERFDIKHGESDSGALITINMPYIRPAHSLQVEQTLQGILKLEKKTLCEQQEDGQSAVERIFVGRLISVLEEHMENTEFNVAMLCRLLGMNKKLLYRKIKQLTGISPVSLIRRVRMTKAALLLLQGEFTVSEVMYRVGYSNPSYFSRCFAAEYNMAPRQYAPCQLLE